MSVRGAVCGCRWSTTGGRLRIVHRCEQHKHRGSEVPRAGELAIIAWQLTRDRVTIEHAVAALAELCAGRDDEERAAMAEHFEHCLGLHTFDRLFDPTPARDPASAPR